MSRPESFTESRAESRPGSFWDRRRAGVRAEEQAFRRHDEAAEAQAVETALAERPDAEVLAELNLPDPDSLKLGDDFTGFMAKGVPQYLRTRALRKLWRSNPVLACVDGLNDYDGDFLTGSTGNGPIATAYRVGKGMLAHITELDRQAEALARAEVAPPPPAEPTPRLPEAETQIAMAEPMPETLAPAEEDALGAPEDAPADPVPRRMRFRFDGDAA